jgi:hypothetical protein
MPDISLNDFFAGQRLTQVAQSAAIRRGVPRTLPAALWTPSSSRPSSDQVEYIQYSGNRQGAKLVNRLSPAKAVNMPGATRKFATAVTVKEKWPIDVTFIDALKSNTPSVAENARRELVKRMADFDSRAEITRTNVVASAFATGKIWANADGDVLPTSVGAALTIDFGIPVGNNLTKNGAGGTYNIGDWSAAGTTISLSLRKLRKANLKANNYPLTTILYGENIPEYLAANTTLKEYFARHQGYRDVLVQENVIPNGTLGWNWKPVETQYMVDANGASQEWFDANFVGIMPDVESDWYEFVEGGNLVPSGTAAMGMSIDQMLSLCQIVNGKFSYAEFTGDPIAINQIQGDCFLCLIKVPGTYYFGTCA